MLGSDSITFAFAFPLDDTPVVWGYGWCLRPLELPEVWRVKKFGRIAEETLWWGFEEETICLVFTLPDGGSWGANHAVADIQPVFIVGWAKRVGVNESDGGAISGGEQTLLDLISWLEGKKGSRSLLGFATGILWVWFLHTAPEPTETVPVPGTGTHWPVKFVVYCESCSTNSTHRFALLHPPCNLTKVACTSIDVRCVFHKVIGW